MSDICKSSPALRALQAACDCVDDPARDATTSRRAFLKTGAGLAAGAAALPLISSPALAQSANDPALRRLLASRRILIKGGIVLTLDPQLGDFASADVMIEDGKIREIRPAIAAGGDTQVVDASNRIVSPGFVDTHSHSYQGLLRGILSNGLLEPDYNRDIQNNLTPAYLATDAYAGLLISALGVGVGREVGGRKIVLDVAIVIGFEQAVGKDAAEQALIGMAVRVDEAWTDD